MPVQLGSKLPREEEARIEIIPLIDIMFFLLASFMLVSLSMVNLKSVKVDLPTATAAFSDSKKDLLSISVDKGGTLYLDRVPCGANELANRLAAARAASPDVRVFVSGDKESRHGDVVRALDIARGAGIQKIGIEIRAEDGSATTSN